MLCPMVLNLIKYNTVSPNMECKSENCGWWNNSTDECVVQSIATCLGAIESDLCRIIEDNLKKVSK